jgi:hypothetical protein
MELVIWLIFQRTLFHPPEIYPTYATDAANSPRKTGILSMELQRFPSGYKMKSSLRMGLKHQNRLVGCTCWCSHGCLGRCCAILTKTKQEKAEPLGIRWLLQSFCCPFDGNQGAGDGWRLSHTKRADWEEGTPFIGRCSSSLPHLPHY